MDHSDNDHEPHERFWRRIYIAVIVNTFVVITALWAFSRYFAN
ncbi:MAG: hypothetical protein ABI791_11080 [Acidobacteriota bacterium]